MPKGELDILLAIRTTSRKQSALSDIGIYRKEACDCNKELYYVVTEYVLISLRFYRQCQSEKKLKPDWSYGFLIIFI